MANTACADLCVQWNEDYDETWSLSDPVTLAPQDLTGWVLKLQVRSAAGAAGAPLLDLEATSDPNATGIYCPTPTNGQFTPRAKQADLQALAATLGQQNLNRLAYDFVAIDSTGVRRVTL